MTAKTRVFIVVIDGLGVGELPDAADYGDAGSNTLVNTAGAVGGISLPFLAGLGLGNIVRVPGLAPAARPGASYGKMAEVSAGKDSTTGHWEMMGLQLDEAFPVYPGGFPERIISQFELAVGRKVLGNRAASGTEIIEELGPEHLATGRPIVYTSADSVFQIASHLEVISLEELYQFCGQAREILTGADGVGRVIARPFTGSAGSFVRTADRRDFSLPPVGPTVLDYAVECGVAVHGIGKISEIFAGRGISTSVHTENNRQVMDEMEAALGIESGIVFANLVDFDMLWGHRNDPVGYAAGLVEADRRLEGLVSRLTPADVLMITADHGCDPTTESTDHSREYVPLLVVDPAAGSPGADLGTRTTMADLGRTVSDWLDFKAPVAGTSFLEEARSS